MSSRSASETAPLFLRASCIYELTQSHSNQVSRKMHRDLLGFLKKSTYFTSFPAVGWRCPGFSAPASARVLRRKGPRLLPILERQETAIFVCKRPEARTRNLDCRLYVLCSCLLSPWPRAILFSSDHYVLHYFFCLFPSSGKIGARSPKHCRKLLPDRFLAMIGAAP